MKLHPYISDKTLYHFPRTLQNPSGLLGVRERPGLSTPAYAAGEGGGPGWAQPDVAVDTLGLGGSFVGCEHGPPSLAWNFLCQDHTPSCPVGQQLLSLWAGRDWRRLSSRGDGAALPGTRHTSVPRAGHVDTTSGRTLRLSHAPF